MDALSSGYISGTVLPAPGEAEIERQKKGMLGIVGKTPGIRLRVGNIMKGLRKSTHHIVVQVSNYGVD